MTMRRWFDVVRLRLRSLFRRGQVERELLSELRFHIEQEAEEARASGLSPEESRRVAMKRIGGIAQVQEECREMRGTNWLETVSQDLRYAGRVLYKSPGFTVVVIATLALSIGATSAIFSILEGVLLRPLPFRDPGRLVRIFTSTQGWPKFPVNPNDFRDFRSRLHSFESMAAYTHTDLQLSGANEEAVRLSGFSVTAGFFHVLGLKPAMGREFNQNDERPANGFVAIVSDRVWRTQLRASRNVLGQKIVLNEVPYKIIGVMPPGVQHPGNMYHAVSYGDTVDVWVPFTFEDPNNRGAHFMDVIGRLKNGVTLAQARGEMNAAMHQLAREHPDNATGWSVLVIPLQQEIVGRSERMLFVLLGAVALVLLLACVNTANLLLARATSRQREMAVRAALGADRPRLVRQVLTESLLLASAGAALGALLAVAGVKALIALLPADFPRSGDISVDAPVLLFTMLIAAGTGILAGIVPAVRGSRIHLLHSLHESGRSNTGTQQTLRLRNGLVVSEVTLACVLLIGAGLMLRSFVNLLRTDPGFRPEQVVTASISLPRVGYKDPAAIAGFSERFLAELRSTPGLTVAGLGSDLPWTGWDDNAGGFQIEGEVAPPHDSFSARYHTATPGYFEALGTPIIRGRAFSEHDRADSRNVLIINQAMANYWKHGNAIGGRMTFDDHPKEKDWMTVVGIVADIKDAPNNAAAKPAFWWPLAQAPFPFGDFSVVVRSSLDPALVANRLREVLRGLDTTLAVADIRTMDRVADASYSASRFAFFLVALFAMLAIVLAAIGTYGVIAYSVNQRIHEFGVRTAMGATPRDVVSSVLANGMRLAISGTMLGVVLGLALSRLLGSLLYGIGVIDPVAIGVTCLISVSVAAIASCVPALRAARVDPMTALRAD